MAEVHRGHHQPGQPVEMWSITDRRQDQEIWPSVMAVEKKGKESQQKTFKQRVPDEAAENKRKARIWGKRAQNL